MKTYQVNPEGYYGEFGGAYIPEILHRCVEELRLAYRRVIDSPDFQEEFAQLLRDYVGRPSPLYLARRLSEQYGCKIYLKREDLNHTGAHKINNAIGQVLLARRMGKRRLIAETGAGMHGVATATVAALFGMEKYSESPTPAIQLAGAAAEFGMILRDSQYKGSSDFDYVTEQLMKIANNEKTEEFLGLSKTASALYE